MPPPHRRCLSFIDAKDHEDRCDDAKDHAADAGDDANHGYDRDDDVEHGYGREDDANDDALPKRTKDRIDNELPS